MNRLTSYFFLLTGLYIILGAIQPAFDAYFIPPKSISYLGLIIGCSLVFLSYYLPRKKLANDIGKTLIIIYITAFTVYIPFSLVYIISDIYQYLKDPNAHWDGLRTLVLVMMVTSIAVYVILIFSYIKLRKNKKIPPSILKK